MSYSIASILATLKHYNIPASHYSFDIRDFKKTDDGYMPIEVLNLYDIIEYLKQFSCIALGVSRWSATYAYMLIRHLNDSGYKGKIVVGGYEITAMNESHPIQDILNIQHFIQGYSEKPLVKLMQGMYTDDQKFIKEDLDQEFLFSPYSEGILNTYSRKIYWETKRGCIFHCGFCEWGNANIGMLPLNTVTIDSDIEIFSHSTIDEINILDATFNVKNDYQDILNKLISRTNSKITFQARFEALKPEFLQFCATHKERLHLEFGLQTIHKNEMEVIGRQNNIDLIRKKLHELNQLGIDYEVSIIYAIPGQTLTSFIDTIEFLRVNQCEKIMAYPLQIPLNSPLESKIKEYQITFKEDDFYVKSVASSFSFTKEERADMDEIASSLGKAQKPSGIFPEYLSKIEHAQFQFEFNMEYFRACGKLHEPIVLIYKGASLQLNDVHNLEAFAGKDCDPLIWPDRFAEDTPGKNNRVQTIMIHDKIVYGESGHCYTYRDF
jgi:radical SAM superfamily enzyme YgiQ (UPF0313 family)